MPGLNHILAPQIIPQRKRVVRKTYLSQLDLNDQRFTLMQMQPKLPSATKVVRKAPVNTLRENCLQSATYTSHTGTLMREPLSSTSELQSIVSGRPGMKTTANNT